MALSWKVCKPTGMDSARDSEHELGRWAYQEGLNGLLMLNTAEGICLLLLLYRPVSEGHARCCVVTHLRRMVGAPLPRPANTTHCISCNIHAHS